MKIIRLKAFTILELTITMLLSTVVIGIAYFAYDITAKSYEEYVANNQDMAILLQLNHLLEKDIKNADLITRTGDVISITDSLTKIDYQFNSNYIVRASIIIDTFKVVNQQLLCAFEGHPVAIDGKNLVDELSFVTVAKRDTIPFHYSKQYSANDLIKIMPYANN